MNEDNQPVMRERDLIESAIKGLMILGRTREEATKEFYAPRYILPK